MKIAMIAPSSGKWKAAANSAIFNGKTFRFSLLSLLTVAAETPEGHDILLIDEQVDDIPWDKRFDLVAITCMTALAPRAYEIAESFRSKNIPVILGGIHPTLCPDEAEQHADAIVVGDAEGVWQTVLNDLQHGMLKNRYKSKVLPDLTRLNRLPRQLLKSRHYSTVNGLQATRGCTNKCNFCSVSAFHNQTHRVRPVKEVVKEMAGFQSRFCIFVDDNLTADREYAKELFHAIEPLRKFWVSQSSIAIADDPEFVRLGANSGCIGFFIGIETFSNKNLLKSEKYCNRAEWYKEAIALFHSFGIAVEAGIVFGFDNDSTEVFQNSLRLLDELEIDAAQISILTPIPGTALYKGVNERIFDHDWGHYDFHTAVFHPNRMTASELQDGHDWVTRKFYSPARIMKRVVNHMKRTKKLATLPYVAAVNMAYYGRVKRWNISGRNPVANEC
ncbi:B12-binding domain-containing radical SAM protein [Desulforhopalus singaporensis]|uniref:Radical SAM superfamily enzyme YgiQ, UPF0313 family n=1 Tax=Desulforhopalus singaporensis TaxID=91360 RepID=A0A1H0VW54_9BACT|nr:radical SAM protein [Desulforhopalus singaporensis]SDP82471.1 Radical SAM superfamily enzyme YgiQ, UPF0313 family [Desulforhopalus singaporensis]